VWLTLYGSYALSRPPLPDGPATVHAEVAREMVAGHDWKNGWGNGAPGAGSSKALDWSIAANYRLFGVSDFAARLPGAVCVLLLAITVYFLGRSLFVWNAAGLYSALIVLAWPGTFLATRELTDAPFLHLETAVVALILWNLLVARQLAALPAIAVSAVAAALIFLTGHWPGMALPLLILATCWVIRLFAPPAEKVRRLLTSWAVIAFLLGDVLIQPHFPSRGPLLWLATIAPLALIVGGWLANQEAFGNQALARRIARYLFAVGLTVGAIAVFFGGHGPVRFTVNKTRWLITASSSRIPLLVFALAVVVGVSGNLLFRLQNKARVANCFLIGILGGIVAAAQAGLVIDSPYSSSQILAEAIRPEINPGDIVAIDGKYADASSLAFYLDRPVLTADSSDGPKSAGFSSVWNGSARVFVWTRTDAAFAAPGASYVIARSGGKEILSNQPNSGGASF